RPGPGHRGPKGRAGATNRQWARGRLTSRVNKTVRGLTRRQAAPKGPRKEGGHGQEPALTPRGGAGGPAPGGGRGPGGGRAWAAAATRQRRRWPARRAGGAVSRTPGRSPAPWRRPPCPRRLLAPGAPERVALQVQVLLQQGRPGVADARG